MFSRLPPPLWGSGPLPVSRKGRRKEALLRCPTVWSTDHTEGQALKRRTGTSGINVFQFLALHRPSNGPWTKRTLPERTMSKGPPPPPTRYILRLWAAITIQEDTRNWKSKEVTRWTAELQVVGGQEGPLRDLGSQQEMRRLQQAGRPIGEKESTSLAHNREYPNPGNRGLSILRLRSTFRLCPSTASSFDLVRFMIDVIDHYSTLRATKSLVSYGRFD
ncbi:NADH-ubiquinone oxidoreductase chain, partial [Striga asiatica]